MSVDIKKNESVEIPVSNIKVLIVVDMQNDFIDGSLGSDYAKNVVLPNVVNKIKNTDADYILFTKDTHFGKDYLNTHEGKYLPVKHCIIGTSGHDFAPEIIDVIKSFSTKKPVVGIYSKVGFGSFSLLDELKSVIHFFNNRDEYECEICGLCTDICVVSNALILRSYFPNMNIKCDSSCCGGTSKEAHDAALTVMKNCHIDIV